MSVINAQQLEKSYRRGNTVTPVLRGVDFVVERGESVFLVGPSGSGKSTLLSILGCLLTADAGRLEILGHDVASMRASERSEMRRDRLGFVFQKFNLVKGLNAVENVAVPLRIRGWSAGKARQRAAELLESVGLSDQAKSRPSCMSSGQCQRVAIARALALDPDILLADEPTASLDADNGQEVMGMFRELIREHGKTAVVVTHDPRIFGFADRICEMEDGKVKQKEVCVSREG